MTGPQDRGEWLAERAAQRPRIVTGAGQIIAEGGRSNDAVLHGRQWLENRLGADPESEITEGDYRYAARRIGRIRDVSIRPEHSEILEDIADVDWEMALARPRWSGRYVNRPETLSERRATTWLSTGTLVERGQPLRGIDGCQYAQAYVRPGGKPAIVVTNDALTQDAIVFPTVPEARQWWESRRPQTGPLLTTAHMSVPSRPTHEEEILAWLMRSPADTRAVAAELGPTTMTSHLRAELLRALEWATEHGGSPEPQVVAEAFGRQLLRAPGWVEVGWPGATRASSYLERILSTSVTRAQACTAVDAIARADAEAVRFRDSQPSVLPGPPRADTSVGRRPDVGPQPDRVLQPPPPGAAADPVPQVRRSQ